MQLEYVRGNGGEERCLVGVFIYVKRLLALQFHLKNSTRCALAESGQRKAHTDGAVDALLQIWLFGESLFDFGNALRCALGAGL